MLGLLSSLTSQQGFDCLPYPEVVLVSFSVLTERSRISQLDVARISQLRSLQDLGADLMSCSGTDFLCGLQQVSYHVCALLSLYVHLSQSQMVIHTSALQGVRTACVGISTRSPWKVHPLSVPSTPWPISSVPGDHQKWCDSKWLQPASSHAKHVSMVAEALSTFLLSYTLSWQCFI